MRVLWYPWERGMVSFKLGLKTKTNIVFKETSHRKINFFMIPFISTFANIIKLREKRAFIHMYA